MEPILHAFLHTFKHTAITLVLLYLTYLLIGYLNNGKGEKVERVLSSRNGSNVVVASLLGCVPQCGFSTTVAQLFCDRKVTVGVLLAVLVSTSDEALAIFMSNGAVSLIAVLLIVKVAIAIAVGVLVDELWQPKVDNALEHCQHEHDEEDCHCHCCDSHGQNIFLFALKKALVLFAIVFAVAFVLELAMDYVGEEILEKLLLSNSVFQPLLVALIGLIPNCAVTVVLAQLMVEGAISIGSGLAGLITAGGMGLIVLIKNNTNRLVTLKVLGILYAVGAVVGLIIHLIF